MAIRDCSTCDHYRPCPDPPMHHGHCNVLGDDGPKWLWEHGSHDCDKWSLKCKDQVLDGCHDPRLRGGINRRLTKRLMTDNVIPFKKPFKLARRDDINPEVVAEWIVQAGLWKNDPDATDQQKDLAQAVLKQWGTD